HPVHLVGDADDLRFSRVTVFFRLPLAIPHLVWLLLWGVIAFVVAILNWFATLITGTPSAAFHRFLSRFVRYALHVSAFLYLAAYALRYGAQLNAYGFLLTDAYPHASPLEGGDQAEQLAFAEPA